MSNGYFDIFLVSKNTHISYLLSSFNWFENIFQYLMFALYCFVFSYEETLCDVLTEIYEELNQPLPASLAGPMSVDTVTVQSPLSQLHSAGSRPTSALAGVSVFWTIRNQQICCILTSRILLIICMSPYVSIC